MSEGFWRFLAAAMLFAVGWSLWIFYQLNPPMIVSGSAYEAAAKARARQTAQGIIQPAPATAPAPVAAAPLADTGKLKFSETLSGVQAEND